jgi:predicted nucleic acid-binding protein
VKYVVDASVAVTWLLGETNAEAAERLFANARSGIDELIAPEFFLAECGHALFRAERKKLIEPGEARKLLETLTADLPKLLLTVHLASRAGGICQYLRKGFYDCLYMALAEQEGVELVTADTKLVNAAKPDYPFVVHLSSVG